MLRYAIKRVSRSYRLFIALTLGVLLATTFFASTNVAADILARDALDSTLDGVIYDIVVNKGASSQTHWNDSVFDDLESQISEVDHVVDKTRTSWFEYAYNSSTVFDIFGLNFNSDFTSNMHIVSGVDTLGPNETYVVSGSLNESMYELNDEITVPIQILNGSNPVPITINWTLTVAGYVEIPKDQILALTQEAAAGILLSPFGFGIETEYNMLLTDWDQTISNLIQNIESEVVNPIVGAIHSIHIKIDRQTLIDPYNIESSTERIRDIATQVLARVEPYGGSIRSSLQLPLTLYGVVSLLMNVAFISMSIPIFFMAWFTGTMVSDASYNLRRREIGLLLTKGYKRGTIRNMFLIEGVIVGGLAGFVSMFLGTAVAYLALGVSSIDFFTVIVQNTTSFVLSTIMGMILALFSVWRPANRASKLEILDSLKQYILVEETSEYKRLLPTITFLLGTYKLIVWILGVNMTGLLNSVNPGNFLLSLGIIVWIAIDQVLNFLGPIFFLYGSTKIFLRGSNKFQEFVVDSAKRFFGSFGTLATRNVKRNPARNAALVFVIGLIVSYGVSSVGSLYSENDRVLREAYFDTGSDVRLQLASGTNISTVLEQVEDYDSVISATPEYHISLSSAGVSISTRGIIPSEWIDTAFWEHDWYQGNAIEMITNLNNNGIILSVSIAKTLQVDVGDSIFVRGPLQPDLHELEVVGLIGFESLLSQFIDDADVSFEGNYPSYVSEAFLNETNMLQLTTKNVLIDTPDTNNGTLLEETLFEEISGIERTYSVSSTMENYFERPIESGMTKIQWVAIAFAVVIAMVGTGLIVILTLREKDAEIALLTVRGFSKSQLFKTLLAEILIMVVFSLLLGSVVGLIQTFGQISNVNQNMSGLIRQRIIILGMPGFMMLGIIGVVLFAAALPVYFASRRPESKVDILRA
ncbi:MAG: FtsX-like permease family protein [Candidatus Lokiarchaeota archaeon]|nr:FtsX-like permease family protein [Candidatus Lokiarchaeota archaeon]